MSELRDASQRAEIVSLPDRLLDCFAEEWLVAEMFHLTAAEASVLLEQCPIAELRSAFCRAALFAIKKMADNREAISMATVTDSIVASFPNAAVTLCSHNETHALKTTYHAREAFRLVLRIVRERRLFYAGRAVADAVKGGVESDVTDALATLAVAQEETADLSDDEETGIETAKRRLADMSREDTVPVPTPWPTVTRMLAGGFRPRRAYVVAGVNSHGKTAACVGIVNAFTALGKSVLYVAFEDRDDVFNRLIAEASGVELRRFENADDRGAAAEAIVSHSGRFEQYRSVTNRTSREIVRLIERRRPALLVVDYIQMIPIHEQESGENERVSWLIAQAMGRIKRACEENDVVLVGVAQLNEKSVMARNNPWPQRSDIAESSAIVQMAHTLLFVHWPRRIKSEEPKEDIRIIVDKNKSGPTGTVPLRFDTGIVRIVEDDSPSQGGQDRASGADLDRGTIWGTE